MRLYDENGQYVGGVLDAEYERTKDSIMPVAIEVQVPKYNAPVSGYTVMVISSFISIVCLFLSLVLSADVAETEESLDGFREVLYYLGVFFNRKTCVIPIVVFIQLAASILLIREGRMFLVAFCVRVLSVILFLSPLTAYGWKFMPFPAISEFVALLITAMAFALKAKTKTGNTKYILYALLLSMLRCLTVCFVVYEVYVFLEEEGPAIVMAYAILFAYSCFEMVIFHSINKEIFERGQTR